MQCVYSSVSKASLQKTGVLLKSAGDFREFSPKKFEHGATGDFGQLEKPAIGGPFCHQRRKFSETWNAWLTWEDSNFHITIPENAFEMSTEFLLFWPKIRLGDLCSSELCKSTNAGANQNDPTAP
jgi:hypothetical protein